MIIWTTILPEDVIAMALFPFILCNKKYIITETIINHEKIHFEQQKELLLIFFYLWYGIEYIIKCLTYGKDAYLNISFEREAYAMETDMQYIKKRKAFSFINYL